MQTRKKVPSNRKPKAATSDILGTAQRAPRVNPKWKEHYARLVDLQETLMRRRIDSANDALSEQPVFSSHMADAATDTYDRDLALGMLSSEQDSLYQVEQAIDRILNGNYGVCELTGKPIEPARLVAVPWTRFSATAEKQLEREGSRKHPRLGPRETVGREPAPKEPEEA
ncbi:MAG TPA: TraR/DksA C4-type zinc finger protein [Patescibacteria group bacterium]|nr:TraR/DksA C4-type zinc finger protein [Patescibacteria group bacterium]